MSLTTSASTTYLAPRPRHACTTRISLSPTPSPSPSSHERSKSPGATLSMSSSTEVEAELDDEDDEDRSKLRPRRAHAAVTSSPPSPSESPSPSPFNASHPICSKPRPARPSRLPLAKLSALFKRRLSPSTDSSVDLYDMLIAFSFAVCLFLFLRALSGSGIQDHHPHVPTREDLHKRAGTFCSVPLSHPISSVYVPASTGHHDKLHKPHHHAGVPPDPHAHASVDPEGSWSYALDHHLPHLHLHQHAHQHEIHGLWNGWKTALRILGYAGEAGVDGEKVDDGVSNVETQAAERRQEPNLDESDPAYPMRIYLSSDSMKVDEEAREAVKNDALNKHRKARGRRAGLPSL